MAKLMIVFVCLSFILAAQAGKIAQADSDEVQGAAVQTAVDLNVSEESAEIVEKPVTEPPVVQASSEEEAQVPKVVPKIIVDDSSESVSQSVAQEKNKKASDSDEEGR